MNKVEYIIRELIDNNDRTFYHLVKFTNSREEFIIETRNLVKLFTILHEKLRP